ncbi:hypothetical protein GGI19_002677 [Coemansia pectinata]|uniref:Glutathione S-transferase n=1 Tax=Coemansia pectinata TaxID=1052879 RepID=A0A9W8GVF6_9FUNG|nr:hypothetical protein GGI19_002677 [Coemansia pectinata]
MEGCNNASSALSLPGAVTGATTPITSTTTTTTTAAEVRAQVAMHIADALAQRYISTKCQVTYKASAPVLCPIARATDYIWQLGLRYPASGLVPSSDYGKVLIMHFVGVWTTRVLPLFLAESGGLASTDLATLNKCIVARRRTLKQRGPFWNGQSVSIAEVVVAPFADEILHSGLIPDSREFGALAAWLAAVRASPLVSNVATQYSDVVLPA